MSGKLYLCGTPIGNLEDITYRVLSTLNSVDVIYAEDTRHSIRLLNHFNISKPLHSYHEHNLESAGQEIVVKLQRGENIALVTDAGMPGISDPGEALVKLCIQNNLPFEVVPGVTAFSMALVGSGLDTSRFVFEGFLSRDKRQKKALLEKIKYESRTLIFYESPHRLKETLKIMKDVFGTRNIVIARELTKKYETFYRDTLEHLIEFFNENEVRGEIVLMVEGSKESEPNALAIDVNETVKDHVFRLIEEGLDKKEALKKVAIDRKMKKSDVYSAIIEED